MWFRLLLLLSSVFACCGGSKGFFWFHEPSMERVPQWRICCAQACIAPMHRCQQQNFALKKITLWVFTWWKCLWFWQWELETVNGTRNHRLQRSQKLAACGTKSKGYELSLHKKKGHNWNSMLIRMGGPAKQTENLNSLVELKGLKRGKHLPIR